MGPASASKAGIARSTSLVFSEVQTRSYILNTPKPLSSVRTDGKIDQVSLLKRYCVLSLLAATGFAQSSGTFTPAGNMTIPRAYHTATLLTTGKVLLIAGTVGVAPYCCRSAELYDPVSGAFAPTGDMTAGRDVYHAATLLPDGTVLIAGYGFVACSTCLSGVGRGPSAEVYNPVTGTFAPTGDMIIPRAGFSATLLPNGKVLIAGGSCCTIYPNTYPTTAELYDPLTGNFTRAGDMVNGRENHTATLLSNGKVLIAGGEANDTWVTAAEVYDPATGTFSAVGGTEAISEVQGIWGLTCCPMARCLALGCFSEPPDRLGQSMILRLQLFIQPAAGQPSEEAQ
jgi:hypothetical protein